VKSMLAPTPVADSLDPLAAILGRMSAAAKAAGRDPAQIELVAVSKQQPWEAVEPVLRAGQIVFGENRVQEAQSRWAGRREGLRLHLIGPLQTNKARDAVDVFDVIETVDRPRLAHALADEIQRAGRAPRLYIQVNTGEEPQKAGVAPAGADAFIKAATGEFGLLIEGLMCVPPADEPPAMHFALLAKIAQRNGLAGLSMGMSADFETAIRFGATSVRVGSALFGGRNYMGPRAA
jgi:PLP dependent protein